MLPPVDLSPELAHKQRLEELKQMAAMDERLGVTRYKFDNIPAELTMRFFQYSTFPYSQTFKIRQTLQDFNRFLFILQNGSQSFNLDKPLCSLKDGTLLYLNPEGVFVKEK